MNPALDQLTASVARLTAEADARRLIGRYMALCDIPVPQHGINDAARCTAIAALFTADAVWEGIGGAHGARFGCQKGRVAIRAHMLRFFTEERPRKTFNTHFLCTEQVEADAAGVTGRWVQFQPWGFEDGAAILRSSRLDVRFAPEDGVLRIARYRTESLFVADLPADWATSQIGTSFLDLPLADEGRA